jgi:hypothetical protein
MKEVLKVMTQDISESREKELHDLWSTALEAMIIPPLYSHGVVIAPNAPEAQSTMFMSPVASLSDPATNISNVKLPALFSTHRIFAITGFNPLGEEREIEMNEQANKSLFGDLCQLEPEPAFIWRSYGFSLGDGGWREDGYCVAFPADSDEALKFGETMVSLGIMHKQGAIYQYDHPSFLAAEEAEGHTEELRRTTVPCALGETVEAVEWVKRIERPAGFDGSSVCRDWVGGWGKKPTPAPELLHQTVQIQGLESMPELNGMMGFAGSYDEADERYHVILSPETPGAPDKVVSLTSKNLKWTPFVKDVTPETSAETSAAPAATAPAKAAPMPARTAESAAEEQEAQAAHKKQAAEMRRKLLETGPTEAAEPPAAPGPAPAPE